MTTIKVRYENKELRQELTHLLDELKAALQFPEFRAALGDDNVIQLYRKIQGVESRLEKDFTLVVIGDFKRGKSTLINALLGEEAVPTDVTPETITINELRFGLQFVAEACLPDGGLVNLQPGSLKAERLAPLLSELPQRPHPLCIIRIQSPNERLAGLCLVDTPGTGDIFERFDRQVHDYLTHADAVVVVISALSPLSASERNFLRASVMSRDFPKIYFVVNMIDLIDSGNNAERVQKLIGTKLAQMFPAARVFGVSALREFRRQQGAGWSDSQRASDLDRKFQHLRDAVEEAIDLHRDWLQFERANAQTRRLIREALLQVDQVHNGLQIRREDLESALAQLPLRSAQLLTELEERQLGLREAVGEMANQANSWLDEFFQRFEQTVMPNMAKFRLEDVQRHFHFYFTDVLRSALNQCVDAHRPQMIELIRQATAGTLEEIHQFSRHQAGCSAVATATLEDFPWTHWDTLELLAERTPLNLVFKILMIPAKSSHIPEYLQQFQERLRLALPEIKQTALEECRKVYGEIGSQITQRLSGFYQQELDAMKSSLQQSQILANRERETLGRAEGDLAWSKGTLARSYARVDNLKEKLLRSIESEKIEG